MRHARPCARAPQPGIIQSDEDNPDNKQIVWEMVKSFIKQPRTIIVATVRWGRGRGAAATHPSTGAGCGARLAARAPKNTRAR